MLSKIYYWLVGSLERIHPLIPVKWKKNIVIFDNIENPACMSLENYSLFQELSLNRNYRVVYLANKKVIQKKGHIEKGVLVLDSSWRTAVRLFGSLLFSRVIIDSYQQFYKLGLSNFYRSPSVTTVYSQHGINYFKIAGLDNCLISSEYYDYFVVSSVEEKKIILRHFLFQDRQVKLLGLARLINSPSSSITQKKKVFIYLTRRDYFSSDTKSTELLIKSVKELIEKLRKKDFSVLLGLHHSIPDAVKSSFKEPLVDENLIAEAKRSSQILVTDFSSIFLDRDSRRQEHYFFLPDANFLSLLSGCDQINIRRTIELLSVKEVSFTASSLIEKIENHESTDLRTLGIIHSPELVKSNYESFIYEIFKDSKERKNRRACENVFDIIDARIKLPVIESSLFINLEKAENSIFFHGFYPVEVNRDEIYFRWSNRCPHLFFKLGRGSWKVEIKIFIEDFKKINELKIFWNSSEVRYELDWEIIKFKVECSHTSNIDLAFLREVDPRIHFSTMLSHDVSFFERELGLAIMTIRFLRIKS